MFCTFHFLPRLPPFRTAADCCSGLGLSGSESSGSIGGCNEALELLAALPGLLLRPRLECACSCFCAFSMSTAFAVNSWMVASASCVSAWSGPCCCLRWSIRTYGGHDGKGQRVIGIGLVMRPASARTRATIGADADERKIDNRHGITRDARAHTHRFVAVLKLNDTHADRSFSPSRRTHANVLTCTGCRPSSRS